MTDDSGLPTEEELGARIFDHEDPPAPSQYEFGFTGLERLREDLARKQQEGH
jgi:hypothetical protein